MPAPNTTPHSPPPAPQAGSSRSPSPPSPSSSLHQVGSRQATRSRTRTRRNMSSSLSTSHRVPHYSHEDHPLSAHNLAKQGFHSFRCLGVPFHVKKRYTFLRELGIGAYGCVALCRDQVLDCNVAIKKVTRVFERDVLARRALREVAILRHIGMCDNVTALLDFDASFIEFSEIYLVLSASEADLSQIIRSGQSLSDAHHQYFVAQILRGVRYMHAAKIVHRDLKPGNLLVNADCALRLCDFGLARAYADASHGYEPCEQDGANPIVDEDEDPLGRRRNSSSSCHPSSGRDGRSQERCQSREERTAHLSRSLSPQSDLKLHTQPKDLKGKNRRLNYPGGPLTEYVATRWYRAPEVMLCFREGYGPELDMWSVGCILAELIGGQPIFPGKNYVDQITRINDILGSPPDSVVDKVGSERAKTYVKALPRMPAVPLQKLYPSAAPEAVDLLSRLLTWDPAERLTADEALRHPWLKAYHESNARWQPPPTFDKFAEVEFIRSLRQFKVGLQREADELKQEIEALEMEEAEAEAEAEAPDAISSTIVETDEANESANEDGQNGEPPHGPWQPGSASRDDRGGDIDSDTEYDADDAGPGNGPRADATTKDQSATDAESVPQACTATSCGTATTHPCHLPVTLASSGSSADTLSSTDTSADEADPLSPQTFDSCRISSAKEVDAVALRQAPSFFRLGHEEEGRHLVTSRYDEKHDLLLQPTLVERQYSNDVFVPEDLLQVAQGLVEYQIESADIHLDSGSRPERPLQAQGVSILPYRDEKASLASKHDGVRSHSNGASHDASASGGPSRPSGAASIRSAGGANGLGGGSTPSLGQGLLENLAIAPSSGSAAVAHASQRYAKQLVLVQDGLMQSSAGLLSELIARGADKAQPTLLITALRHPSTYVRPQDARHVTVLDGSSYCCGYEAEAADGDHEGEDEEGTLRLQSCQRIARSVITKLEAINTQGRLTVLIDSLDTIADQSQEGVEGVYSLIRTLLGRMNAFSRLVVGFQGDSASTSAALVSALNTPLIWGPKTGAQAQSAGSDTNAAAGTILTVRLHSPAVMRYISRNYGLRPPSTSIVVARALAGESSVAGAIESSAAWLRSGSENPADTEADVRFWDILRNIASRGALGIPSYESGGGTGGWWADGHVAADEVECIFKSPSQTRAASRQGVAQAAATIHSDRICFEDVIGTVAQDGESGRHPRSNGWGFLELKYQARSGKVHEELVGCVVDEAGRGHGRSDGGRRLYLRALDMADRRGQRGEAVGSVPSAAGAGAAGMGAAAAVPPASVAPVGTDPHASMVSRLPFNLSETESQRARREGVPLPFAFYQSASASASGAVQGGSAAAAAAARGEQQPIEQGIRGSTGNSTIFFEPEAGDDEDDEDPDDDLDL